MANLREKVCINTATLDLHGQLFVGTDGLPELEVEEQWACTEVPAIYRPATFPAAWSVQPIAPIRCRALYDAWTDIEAVLQHIRDAQQEGETEEAMQ